MHQLFPLTVRPQGSSWGRFLRLAPSAASAYDSNMVPLRYFFLLLTCIMLSVPVQVYGRCCLETRSAATESAGAFGSSLPNGGSQGKCCSCDEASTKVAVDRQCPTSDCCQSVCQCSKRAGTFGVATYSESPPFVFVTTLATLPRPYPISPSTLECGTQPAVIPIAHNRRQATLCVWRK